MQILEQFLKIKKLLSSNLSVSYERLSIGIINSRGQKFVQVDCDRFALLYSKLYSIDNIDFAISKFTNLLTRYMASELKNGV